MVPISCDRKWSFYSLVVIVSKDYDQVAFGVSNRGTFMIHIFHLLLWILSRFVWFLFVVLAYCHAEVKPMADLLNRQIPLILVLRSSVWKLPEHTFLSELLLPPTLFFRGGVAMGGVQLGAVAVIQTTYDTRYCHAGSQTSRSASRKKSKSGNRLKFTNHHENQMSFLYLSSLVGH